jgi:S-adenosylmethionine synthetase
MPQLADIKVMGSSSQRSNSPYDCMRHGRQSYVEAKDVVGKLAREAAERASNCAVDVMVNTADDPSRGEVYLSVTGTSAEAGDDGEVGRGNQPSGLITPYRPIGIEAAAGNNPVSHVRKLYSLAAGAIASGIAGQESGIQDATCVLVSQIGRAIEDPQMADVRLVTEDGQLSATIENRIRDRVHAELSRFPELQNALLEGV